jgi:branched-chain amino acid aminotransferase
MKVVLDGRVVDAAAAGIDAANLDGSFDDGVEETLALKAGRPRRFDGAFERLKRGVTALDLPFAWPPAQLQAWIAKLAAENRHESGTVRIVIGKSGTTQRLAMFTAERPGVDVVCAIVVPGIARSGAPGITRLRHPETLAARAALKAADAEAAILLNTAGRVAGAIGGDVFALVQDTMITPPAEEGASGSLTRNDVVRMAHAEEKPLTVEMLRAASELAIADGVGLRPVIELDGVAVNGGELGLITSLMASRI